MKKPTIIERYTDNGQHSHYALIETETGKLLWSEAPEEETQQVENLNIPDKWFDLFNHRHPDEVSKILNAELTQIMAERENKDFCQCLEAEYSPNHDNCNKCKLPVKG